MSDPSNERHPSSMTAEQTQALRDSDPSAFDDDVLNDEAGGGKTAADEKPPVDKPAGSEAAAEPAEGADADAPAVGADDKTGEADEGAASGKPPTVVPKARLDEVIGQRNQAEALSRQQAAELATLREQLATTKPPKDFEAEFDALQDQYDNGDLDAKEFAKAQRALQREENEHIATVAALKASQQTVEQAVARSWNEEVAAFAKSNPGFLEDPANVDVFQRSLNSVAAFYGTTISQAELLAKASKQAFEHTGYVPPGGAAAAKTADGQPTDPLAAAGAERRSVNAARAAEASGAPPQITGGVGERGGPARGVDLEHLKPGTFSSKLTKAEQEKLLGEGAV